MERNLPQAEQYTKKNRRRSIWKRIVSALGCIVVFCTTYALILPAITMEKECEITEHQHLENCYTRVTSQQVSQLVCNAQTLGIHVHTDSCCDAEGKIQCGHADFVVHSHSKFCYDENSALLCSLPMLQTHVHEESCFVVPEADVHVHGDACYEMHQGEQTCTISEGEGAHAHSETCYEATTITVCQLTESVGHQHGADCTDESGALICTTEESEGHAHGETCVETASTLICQTEESNGHQHGQTCYVQDRKLICELPETVTESTAPVLVCTEAILELHTHDDGCRDGNGALICGKTEVLEHSHSEACITTTEVSMDAANMTCTLTEDETHTHGALCYGTWTLSCEISEHTHTEECQPDSDLTEEEQARVDAVIAQIDEIPSADEIDAAILAYEEAADYTGEEAYLTQVYTKVGEAYSAYSALGEGLQPFVTNSLKLMELEYIWSAMTLEESVNDNQGTYEETLNGDYAYIANLGVFERQTGAKPFDGDNEPGNDSAADNQILRTYDLATYTIQFETHLRNAVANDNIGGYKTGRLHFEFILPVNSEQAVFQPDSMSWLKTYTDVAYTHEEVTLENGTVVQAIRGSFIMEPTTSNPAAISPGLRTLEVVFRAMTMKNGEKLTPSFTLWLEYNKVGAEYRDDRKVHTNIVTGLEYQCEETDEVKDQPGVTGEPHGKEAVTISEEITISAAPRYNVQMHYGLEANNTKLGTFDFSTGGAYAPNKNAGTYDGRIYGYGLSIALEGAGEKGLRGIELPDENKAITFSVDLETFVKPTNESTTYNVTETHRPLLWSAGMSMGSIRDGTRERNSGTVSGRIYFAPYNQFEGVNEGYRYSAAYKGGTWIGELDPNDPNRINFTVSGFEINLDHFPNHYDSASGNAWYDKADLGESGKEFWNIKKKAIFSAGEFWVVQPYNSTDETSDDLRYLYPDATTKLTAKITDVSITSISGQTQNSNVVSGDDNYTYDDPYERGAGDMNAVIWYAKHKTYDELSIGGYYTQKDWALAGQEISIVCHTQLYGQEGRNRGGALDMLLKFDDAFFEPTGADQGTAKWSVMLWAAKPDGTGWDHKGLDPDDPGYDSEMMQADVDDLVYYTSLAELKADGAVCVGALGQKRDIYGAGTDQFKVRVHGTVKSEGTAGNVFMTAFSLRSWRFSDLTDAVREEYGLGTTFPTDAQYIQYVQQEMPDWRAQTRAAGLQYKYTDYVTAGYIESYDITTGSGGGVNGANGHGTSQKATYIGGIYQGASGDYDYIDSCYVVPYAVEIGKTTAQTNTNGTSKTEYELSLSQRYADYVLSPSVRRLAGETETEGAVLTTTVYIEDVLPKNLEFIPGSLRWEGQDGSITYQQADDWKSPGTITGGIQATDTPPDDPDAQWIELETTLNAEGLVVLRMALHNVVMDANVSGSIGQIYYSCVISESAQHMETLTNEVSIWSPEDNREIRSENNNFDNHQITALRSTALSLSKLSDQLVTEWYAPIGYAMNVGNNASDDLQNTIIVESLPFNGIDRTSFHGRLLVTEFSAGLLNSTTTSAPTGFTFYYTTKEAYAGIRAEELETADFTEANGWTKLSYGGTSASGLTGFALPGEEMQKSWNEYENQQITAIAAVGTLPKQTTLKMHITLSLPSGKANDYLINFLSQDIGQGLETYARASVVSRTLSGLTWNDMDADGVQDSGEERISGVKVSLLKLENGAYVPYCYPGTTASVVIQTGQQVSVQTGLVTDYQEGRYLFTDLPEGTFAVQFKSGDFDITSLKASPVNVGADTLDSDGVPTYSDDGTHLLNTQIFGIDMPAAAKLTYGTYESTDNDSGFFVKTYELPETGGTGTTTYTMAGLVLMLCSAAAYLLYRHSKRRREVA